MRTLPLALLLLPLLTACPGSDKDKDVGSDPTDTGEGPVDDPPAECDPDALVEVIEASSEQTGYACVIRYRFPEGCDTFTVQGVIVEEVPEDGPAKLVAPDDCGSALSTNYEWDQSTHGTYDYAVSKSGNCLPGGQGDSSSALECNSATQALSDTWDLYLPAPPEYYSCEDYYGDVELDFIYGDEDCEQTASLREAGCVPKVDVPVDFVYRTVGNRNNDGVQHATLMPLLRDQPGFSERAWIRKVRVTDWGDADHMMVLGWGHGFEVSDDDVVDRTTNHELTTTNFQKTFAVGQVGMNTVFSLDGLPSLQASYEAPQVRVDWSCQVDPNDPHYTLLAPIPSFQAAIDSLDLPGVTRDHKMVLRFPEPGIATLELKGRSRDKISFEIYPLGNGQFGFDIDRKARGGFHIAGTLSGNGQTRQAQFSTFVVRGLNVGTPSLTFTSL